MFDIIVESKQELYNLGRAAEAKIQQLEEHRRCASTYRLLNMTGNAQFEMTMAADAERELASIGKRQTELMDFLMQNGEAFYL